MTEQLDRAAIESQIVALDNAIETMRSVGLPYGPLQSQKVDLDNALNSAARAEAANSLDSTLTAKMVWIAFYGADGKVTQPVTVLPARRGVQIRIRPQGDTAFDVKPSDYTPRAKGAGNVKKFKVIDTGQMPPQFAEKVDLDVVYDGWPGLFAAIGCDSTNETNSKYNDAYQVGSRKWKVEVEHVA